MSERPTEWMWLDARATVTVTELSQACGLSTGELAELMEYGALVPHEAMREAPGQPERVFSAANVSPLRNAGKLRAAYDLDLFTMSLLLDHIRRIEELERELRSLQAKAPSR